MSFYRLFGMVILCLGFLHLIFIGGLSYSYTGLAQFCYKYCLFYQMSQGINPLLFSGRICVVSRKSILIECLKILMEKLSGPVCLQFETVDSVASIVMCLFRCHFRYVIKSPEFLVMSFIPDSADQCCVFPSFFS